MRSINRQLAQFCSLRSYSFSTAANQGLASFGIHYLSLKGYKLVDESLSASVMLCDVQLDDIRPDRQNHITK